MKRFFFGWSILRSVYSYLSSWINSITYKFFTKKKKKVRDRSHRYKKFTYIFIKRLNKFYRSWYDCDVLVTWNYFLLNKTRVKIFFFSESTVFVFDFVFVFLFFYYLAIIFGIVMLHYLSLYSYQFLLFFIFYNSFIFLLSNLQKLLSILRVTFTIMVIVIY